MTIGELIKKLQYLKDTVPEVVDGTCVVMRADSGYERALGNLISETRLTPNNSTITRVVLDGVDSSTINLRDMMIHDQR